MGLRIATNVASISAQRNLQIASGELGRNYDRLATGRRIARASDDAAGVGISARLRAQVRSLDQATRNAQDAVSLVQTAEQSLTELEGILLRARELAVQAQNGTLTSNDRANLQAEFSQLQSTIDQIADGVEFNNLKLLNDSATNFTFQVGPDTAVGVDTLVLNGIDVNGTVLTVAAAQASIGTAAAALSAVGNIDTALEAVSTRRGTLGATQNRLEATISALRSRSENLASANSRILDVDIATETARLTQNSILQQAAISVLAQANLQPQAALSLLG